MSALFDAIDSHVQAAIRSMYTCLPGKVLVVKEQNGSTVVDVEIGIARVLEDDRSFYEPVIYDVPLVWPSSSGCYITTPIVEGDTVLLYFSMRAASEWKNGGGEFQVPFSKRLHNLNDAFATPSMLPYGLSPNVDSEAVRVSSGATEIRILKDGTIELGEGATEQLLKGNAFKTLFDTLLSALSTHTHPVSGSTAAASVDLSAAITSSFPGNKLPTTVLSEVSKTK